jgi:hypothetical protein
VAFLRPFEMFFGIFFTIITLFIFVSLLLSWLVTSPSEAPRAQALTGRRQHRQGRALGLRRVMRLHHRQPDDLQPDERAAAVLVAGAPPARDRTRRPIMLGSTSRWTTFCWCW